MRIQKKGTIKYVSSMSENELEILIEFRNLLDTLKIPNTSWADAPRCGLFRLGVNFDYKLLKQKLKKFRDKKLI